VTEHTSVLTQVSAGHDTLHWMVDRVPWRRGPTIMTRCTQVVIITHKALETQARKVAFHTRITADTCKSFQLQT